jgi:membrane protease YdiL (CAAX protease family)
VFNCFRYYGLVAWPLARPGNLYGYLLLLYFHFIFAANVLVPVLIMNRVNGQGNPIRWGAWGRFSVTTPLSVVLVVTSAAAVFMAIGIVTRIQIQPPGPFWGIVAIAVIKAALTGGTEEICYRGILQPACVKRYGRIPGIVFQALLYTAFHMHLGPVVFFGAGYFGCVLALGLIFGAVTQRTAGIGWALIIHVSINIVVEWLNISSI